MRVSVLGVADGLKGLDDLLGEKSSGPSRPLVSDIQNA
jgi:hypothetical protein